MIRLWQRRAIGILTLGGSFLGTVIAIPFVFTQEHWLAKVITLIFLLLYCSGVWCGLRLLEASEKSLKHSTLYWTLQIPYCMSPLAGYSFTSGAFVFVSFNFTSGFSWVARLGSQFEYSLMQPEKPFAIGINLFALAVAAFLAYQWNNAHRPAIDEPAE